MSQTELFPTPQQTEFGDTITADPTTGAKKADTAKPRVDLLPPHAILDTAEIMRQGAKKYGERNWEAGMAWSRPYSALQRHMLAWWGGEDIDIESGKSHLAHAMCNLMFLMEYERTKNGTDDRPTTQPCGCKRKPNKTGTGCSST